LGQRGALGFEVRRAVRAAPNAPKANPLERERAVISAAKLGVFRAVLIGNQNYGATGWRNLSTPHKDIDQIADLLRTRYGFEVEVIKDAVREKIGATFFRLAQTVGPDDSLLIYYAGLRAFLKTASGNRGNWIPVDAINDWVGMMAARKVMVVWDSCFSGLLLRDGGDVFLQAAQSEEARLELLRTEAEARSRVFLTSGRDAPVLDDGGDGHSVFARAFLSVLRDNGGVITGRTLFARVEQGVLMVSRVVSRSEVTQQPDFRPMAGAGHIGGDFLFVPRM
jgi:uncharacterized protein